MCAAFPQPEKGKDGSLQPELGCGQGPHVAWHGSASSDFQWVALAWIQLQPPQQKDHVTHSCASPSRPSKKARSRLQYGPGCVLASHIGSTPSSGRPAAMLMVLISQAQREPLQLEAEHASAGIGPSQALATVLALLQW